MSRLTRKEFSEKYDINSSTLRVYINRGVIEEDDGYINEKSYKNKLFLAKHLTKSGKTEKASEEFPDVKTPQKKQLQSENEDVGDSAFGLEKQKLQAQVLKMQQEIEILQLKKTKIRNEAISMDDAKSAFAIFIGSVSNAFLNAYESVLTDIKGEFGISREKMAEIKSRLIPIHNQAIEAAVKVAKKQMSLAADEYSEKLGRGEKA
jgi:hypothetical protein